MAQINHEEKLDELNETMKADAEKWVTEKLPERIIFYNELLKKPEFCIPDKSFQILREMRALAKEDFINDKGLDSSEIMNAKIIQRISKSNKYITDVIDMSKPHVIELFNDCGVLKMWLKLLMPKIADCENIGVTIKETVRKIISEAEINANVYHTNIINYYQRRSKLVTQFIKNPEVEDYLHAIEEWDIVVYWVIIKCLINLRDSYLLIHHIIITNFDKINMPDSLSNMNKLYQIY